MNHYTEIHPKEGCSICEAKKTGTSTIEDTLVKVALLSSRRDELESQLDALVGYVRELSLTDWQNAINQLNASGHVEVAGLVRHFMVNAMSMFTGGD